MKYFNTFLALSVATIILGCSGKREPKQADHPVADQGEYPISPVDIRHVKMTDAFWLPVIKTVQEKTIPYALKKCREEGRFDNFLIAGGEMDGTTRGAMPFDDTDVYKIIEGASNSLISSPNPELEKLLDSLISIIAVGQEPDGYLTTWRTINPAHPPADWVPVEEGRRWESLGNSHELYNAGHLYEAAAVHYRATKKRNLLDIALKNADLIVKTFGDGEQQIHAVPGHEIIETGLIQLYRISGKQAYLDMAKYFLDHRGDENNHQLYGAYAQDSIPVVDQKEAVGHAVRAVYMYAAMTDIAAIDKDSAYLKAVHAIWDNMVTKKMYLTGGIGALHNGEAFGANYELPNLTAYSETCAAIGDVYWNHRLHNLSGDVRYFDVIERTLYNGLLSGLSLDGQKFFYPNALESDGTYKFNRGACTRQDWFDCSCCPTNLIRFIPSLPGLLYSKTKDTVYLNLYASNTARIDLENHSITLKEETAYPWNGDVRLRIDSTNVGPFSLRFRVPGWVRNEVLPGDLYSYVHPSAPDISAAINGETVETPIRNGYITLTRNWKPGDTVEVIFPMRVREVRANEKIDDDAGKLALEYGPLVYAVEETDNKENFDAIAIGTTDGFEVTRDPELLGGVNVLRGKNLTAIPYYAWSNRGAGKMKVWLPATASADTSAKEN